LEGKEEREASGFTVGIVDMGFDYESTPPDLWNVQTPLEFQYLKGFVTSFSTQLEEILFRQGITVSGPFEDYEEMTYPERSRCDFIVQPNLKIFFEGLEWDRESYQKLPQYWGPRQQRYRYMKQTATLQVRAELSYVIHDPLTNEKLERHKLKTDSVYHTFEALGVMHYKETGASVGEVPLSHDSEHPNYMNGQYVFGKVLAKLYPIFMERVARLVSVEEFVHLQQYKEEIKDKKRY